MFVNIIKIQLNLIIKAVLNLFGSKFSDRKRDKMIFDDNDTKTQWEDDFKLLPAENWINGNGLLP